MARDGDGEPVVIRNEPVLDDGTPMPTRYWLVGRRGSGGGQPAGDGGRGPPRRGRGRPGRAGRRPPRYAAERDAAIPPGWTGPRPSGGVGGTRRGVKCLHAHYAWHLAGGDDPVGRWVAAQLRGGGSAGPAR